MTRTVRWKRLALLSCVVVVFLLAAIFVRNALNFMIAVKTPSAQSEMQGVHTAMSTLLADTRVESLHELFARIPALELRNDEDCVLKYGERCTEIMYALLREGRNADVGLRPELRQRLGTAYMYLDDDPWGRPYQFWISPPTPEQGCVVPEKAFVSYRHDRSQGKTFHTFAEPDLHVCIYSLGPNGRSDQPIHHNGELQPEGDDIGAW